MKILEMIEEGKENCVGCSACCNVCPKNAISMKPDIEGFLYPIIEKKLCVDCGICEEVCPMLQEKSNIKDAEKTIKAFAFCSKNDEERWLSSSGGVFSILSRYVLLRGGVVFGAAFDEFWGVHHISIKSVTDLSKLRGAKYVQSRIENTYKQAKDELSKGKLVLFSGTPCQVEGLNAYIGARMDNLILVDMICHGVPSPLIWNKYLDWKKRTGDIVAITFRKKNISWEKYSLEFDYMNSYQEAMLSNKDPYMKGFLQDLYLRPSCYCCSFKKRNRQSDFTIADFWGIDEVVPKMNDHKGTSLVILHTDKAAGIFSQIEGEKCEVSFEKAIRSNTAMLESVGKNINRDIFFVSVLQGHDCIEKILRRYTTPSFWKRAYFFCRYIAGTIKNFIWKKSNKL